MAMNYTEKQSHWISHLLEAERSGLSLAQFAKQNELPVNQLYAWRARLKKMETPSVIGASAFIHVEPIQNASSSAAICAVLHNGVQLHLAELTMTQLRMLNSL